MSQTKSLQVAAKLLLDLEYNVMKILFYIFPRVVLFNRSSILAKLVYWQGDEDWNPPIIRR